MKHKQLLFLSIFLIGMSSCDLFNTDDNDPLTNECRLTKKSYDIPNDPARSETSYSYNSNDQLIGIVNEEYDLDPLPYVMRTALSYSGDLVDQIDVYSTFQNDPEELNFNYNFYYTNSKPDSISFLGHNAYEFHIGYILIEYNSDKISIVKTFRKDNNTTAYTLYSTENITWNGNNISKIEGTLQGFTYTHEYEYDTMKSAIVNVSLGIINPNNLSALSENNVIRDTYSSANGVINDLMISYSYNDNDYPLTSSGGSMYPTYSYQYICN